MTTGQTLQLMVETLTKVNEQQGRQISELSRQVKELTAQIAWFRRQMFGRKSEKNINIDNGPNLFDTAGVELETTEDKPEEPQPEPMMETITRKSQKGTKNRVRHGTIFPFLNSGLSNPKALV